MNPIKAISQPATTHSTDGPRSLGEAADAFEALFLGNLLKTAREASQSLDADQANSTMMEYAEEFLSQQIARSGGFGLGKLIMKQMDQQGAQTKGPPLVNSSGP